MEQHENINASKKVLFNGHITLNSINEFSTACSEAGFENNDIIKLFAALRLKYPKKYEIPYELGHIYAAEGDLYQAALCFAQSLDLSSESCDENDMLFYLFSQISNAEEKFELMYRIAIADSISIQLRYRIFYEIIYSNFVGIGVNNASYNINELFSKIIHLITEKNIQYNKHNSNDGSKNVILMPSQFLGPLHGPTQTTLVIANSLVEMGYEPIIIASNPIQFDKKYTTPSCLLHPNIVSSYNRNATFHIDESGIKCEQGVHQFSTIVNRGNEYPFVHLNGSFDEKIAFLPNLLEDFIKKNTPIIAIGSPHLHAEIMAMYINVYLLPCSFSLPMTENCHSILCRNIKDSESKKAKEYKYELIESRFPYGIRFNALNDGASNLDTTKASQISFSLVGGRLELEIEDIMMVRLSEIQKVYPDAIFKFIGVDGNDKFKNRLSNYISLTNCVFTGFVKDIKLELIKTHFYLNPKRNGGGTSVLEALSLSIPTICFKSGDGYHTAGDFFSFDDNLEALTFISKYLNDSEFKKNVTAECIHSYILNTDVKKVINDLTRGRLS